LSSLVDQLSNGTGLSVFVCKLTFGKPGDTKETSPQTARKHLTSAKGGKSGRTTAQSGVSTNSKV